MLMVDLMILFCLKWDNFYWIGVLNKLKVNFYDLFNNQNVFSATISVHITMSYYWFNIQDLLQQAKDKYHNRGGK